jgi:hypothetical protein
MTAGCGGTDAFAFDEQGLQLIWDSVSLPNGYLGAPAVTRRGSLSLSAGFSAASEIDYPMFRRFVLTTDNTCEAAVLAPVVTGTNPDGTTDYKFALALVTVKNGAMSQAQFTDGMGSLIGGFLTDKALTAYVKLAVMAPSGNAVYVETENVADGSSGLVKIAWAPNGNYMAATVTDMGTVSPTGGFFGTSMVMDPNGKFIDLGMRQAPLVRVALQ